MIKSSSRISCAPTRKVRLLKGMGPGFSFLDLGACFWGFGFAIPASHYDTAQCDTRKPL